MSYSALTRHHYPDQHAPHHAQGCFPGHVGGYYSYPGVGAAELSFVASSVWADADLGGKCYTPGNELYLACQAEPAACGICNVAGARATAKIRQALTELKYGPLPSGGAWGPSDKAAWAKFTSDHGLPAGPGLVNKAGIFKLEEELRNPSRAGFGKLAIALLLLAGGVATVAAVSGKRRKGQRTGRAVVRMK